MSRVIWLVPTASKLTLACISWQLEHHVQVHEYFSKHFTSLRNIQTTTVIYQPHACHYSSPLESDCWVFRLLPFIPSFAMRVSQLLVPAFLETAAIHVWLLLSPALSVYLILFLECTNFVRPFSFLLEINWQTGVYSYLMRQRWIPVISWPQLSCCPRDSSCLFLVY